MKPLLLLALAAVVLLALRRRDERIPAGCCDECGHLSEVHDDGCLVEECPCERDDLTSWYGILREPDDGIAPPDPWTTGLLGLDRVIAEDRARRDWRNATKSYARDAGWTP